MGKSVENPRKHIVSVRVTDDELAELKRLEKTTGSTRSELLLKGVEVVILWEGKP